MKSNEHHENGTKLGNGLEIVMNFQTGSRIYALNTSVLLIH